MMGQPLFRTPQRRGPSDERILPLINVVFLLLIFFMVAGRLTAGDPFPVQPPASASQAAESAGETILHIGADGALALNGQALAQTDLPGALAGLSARATALPVRVKADGQAEALAVVRVLQHLRRAGVERVILTTRAGG